MAIVRGLAVWLLIIVIESVHGTLRQVFLAPLMGDFPARRLAFFTGMLLIFAAALLTIRWIRPRYLKDLLLIGASWAVLTLAFEFVMGWALGLTRERMLEDYDLSRGGLMGFGIVFMAVVPYLAARIRGIELRRST